MVDYLAPRSKKSGGRLHLTWKQTEPENERTRTEAEPEPAISSGGSCMDAFNEESKGTTKRTDGQKKGLVRFSSVWFGLVWFGLVRPRSIEGLWAMDCRRGGRPRAAATSAALNVPVARAQAQASHVDLESC